MKNLFKILLIAIPVFIQCRFSKAQISGFGSGTPLSGVTISTGLHYMDKIRAEVSGITISGSTACIDTSTFTSGQFSVGDIALLIQMNGTGIGTHQNVRIVANTCSPSANLKVQAVSGFIHSYTPTGTNNKVQLIKINEYVSLTVTGSAIITCHTWDGHTGGILPLVVNGTLEVAGGTFNVDGKGFSGDDAGYIYNGGAGGSKATSYSAGSVSAPANGSQYTGTCMTSAFSNVGNNGGIAGSTGSTNTNTGSAVNYGASTINADLRMGTPGYWISGYGGGKGAQGGGVGGDGANSTAPCTTNLSGQSGSQGKDGGAGGYGGRGGRGGGCIVIKAGAVDITGYVIAFSSDGGAGQWGGNGSNGGLGGEGGEGGQGCCDNSTPILGGGKGAFGDNGEPGDGGDGGDGGNPGYIWIASQTTYTFVSSFRYDNFRVNGGAVGQGGKGGYGGGNMTNTKVDVINECTQDLCPIPNAGCIYSCDADKAMCILANNFDFTLETAFGGGFKILFRNTSGYTNDPSAEYFSTGIDANTLFAYEGCNVYKAEWLDGNPKDPDLMFRNFNNAGGYPACAGEISLTPAITSTGCNSAIPSYPVYIEFHNNAGQPILTYNHLNETSPAYIEEICSPNTRIYVNSCAIDDFSFDTEGNSGRVGSIGSLGSIDNNNPSDNVVIETGVLWKKNTSSIDAIAKFNPLGVIMSPNPASDEVWIELELGENQTSKITVLDLNGKSVLSQINKLIAGKNKFNIETKSLVSGIYFIELNVENVLSRLQLVIQ